MKIAGLESGGIATTCVAVAAAIATMLLSQAPAPASQRDDWPFYGHDAGGMRYSPLAQITRENVSRLTAAWTFHTGDVSNGRAGRKRGGFETTPLVVDRTLYLTTGFDRVIALDPETGRERWTYDPLVELRADYGDGLINRGLATWADPERRDGEPCRRRLFEATLDARLVALDAATGSPCADFGSNGQVSLRDVPEYQAGWYHMTSPPAVIDGLVVVGSAIDDNNRVKVAAMTYQLAPDGRQFVVIAAGGHAKITEEPLGDALVAFALR